MQAYSCLLRYGASTTAVKTAAAGAMQGCRLLRTSVCLRAAYFRIYMHLHAHLHDCMDTIVGYRRC